MILARGKTALRIVRRPAFRYTDHVELTGPRAGATRRRLDLPSTQSSLSSLLEHCMRPFLFLKSPLILILVLAAAQTAPAAQPAVRPAPLAANWRTMLDKYCVTCHNERS